MSGWTHRIDAATPMNSLICPYCVRPIDPNALVYRCPVQGDQPCREEFPGDGRTPGAECPRGHGLSYLAMCPHDDCRNTLPARYLEAPSRFIGLVGPTNSGKSTYLAVLVRELKRHAGEGLDITLIPADEWTSERYGERYEPLLTKRRLVNPTQSAERDPGTARPLIYVLTVRRTHVRVLRGQGRAQSVNLVIYDSAGEDVGRFDRMERYMRYLRYAAGVVFLIDPLTQPHAAADLTHVPGEAWNHEALAEQVIINTTNQLRIAHGVHDDRKKVPVPAAVAVSKVDEFRSSLIDGSPFLRGSARHDGLDVTDRADVHEYVRALLRQWNWPLDKYLDNSYDSYGLFGFSALGAPVEDNAVAAGGLRPYRVLDPMFWFMSEFGLIPQVRGVP
jgi:double-GTPase-like protein